MQGDAMEKNYYTIMQSPAGEFILTSDGTAITSIRSKNNTGFKSAQKGVNDPAPFKEAVKQLNEYFAGKRTKFELPLNPEGTDFQKQVWKELARIGYGKTTTYGQIAEKLG